ncbi:MULTISPECIES: hypothetical protein [unclassified Streptomyces]|uniref:hypothetical protein n=1 Tax=unclassified Streptomyces TaxID=2593676 RepID=UPI000DB97D4E|nr:MULTISPECIES: hypothetical protein [unclassified Streptomyces]MYT69058.1 hypothetical protein [Streptomyces sp. SID8367]RAJ82566.1 hypothetical protein K377_04286 [Streptomyces sp. PsTaAH-137]
MHHDAPPLTPHDASPAERLTELTAALAADLDQGRWTPGPLERILVFRLLVATAGDGQLTSDRLRETLWEGNLALTTVGGGRLAQLLAELHDTSTRTAAEADAVRGAATVLLERVARDVPEGDLPCAAL